MDQPTSRTFSVDDQGDGFDLAFLEGGQQVGGAWLPIGVMGDDAAFDLAKTLGQSFVDSARPRSAGLS